MTLTARISLATSLTATPHVEHTPDWLVQQLEAVRASLLGMMPPQTLWLADALQHSLGRTGKLLRPQMTLVCGHMVGCTQTHALIEAAAVAEMIHIATLLHDDVLDDAELRRGLPTVKQRWGNEVAILSGDYLLAQASLKLSRIGNIRLVGIFSEVLAALCDGEVNQLCSRFQLDMTMTDYLTKCQQKTACLFGAACEAAGVVAALPEPDIQALKQFGLAYGVAFQLVDDLLDFTADAASVGKPVMGDLCNGIVTAPIILAMQQPHYAAAIRQQVDALFKHMQAGQPADDLQRLKNLLQQADSFTLTRQLAEQQLQAGLTRLPHTSESLNNLCQRMFVPLSKRG
jgi:geranylgeranyl pyrophosphate synthase